jgi:hypothetical protein
MATIFANKLPVGYNFGLSRSVAQSGSAPGLGPGGPRFESLYSDHFQIASLDAQSSKNRQTIFLKVTIKVT